MSPDSPALTIALGQIALIAILAALGLAWSLCEGYVETRRHRRETGAPPFRLGAWLRVRAARLAARAQHAPAQGDEVSRED